jgi:hypothetical protein
MSWATTPTKQINTSGGEAGGGGGGNAADADAGAEHSDDSHNEARREAEGTEPDAPRARLVRPPAPGDADDDDDVEAGNELAGSDIDEVRAWVAAAYAAAMSRMPVYARSFREAAARLENGGAPCATLALGILLWQRRRRRRRRQR